MNEANATLAMQGAMIARLQSLVPDKVKGIWDWIPESQDPEGTVYPYISIGDLSGSRWKPTGWQGTYTFHIFSEFRGYEEAIAIMGAMIDAFESEPLSIDGVDVVFCEYENHHTLRDPDGLTRHVPVIFKVWMQW